MLQNLSVQQVLAMFELLPDIIFWIKDVDSKIVFGNKNFIQHLGAKSLDQVIGKRDHDFSSAIVANQFVVDDQKVMAGHSVTDRLEMNKARNGQLMWFLTSKRPLYNDENIVIGSYGVTRQLSKTVKSLTGVEQVKSPVEYIKRYYAKPITVEKLAKISHLSVSALERRFKKYLSKTPKQFINEVRLQHARRMLVESNLSIAEIAYQTGFEDHSYFSKQFKLMFSVLPSKFRQQVLA